MGGTDRGRGRPGRGSHAIVPVREAVLVPALALAALLARVPSAEARGGDPVTVRGRVTDEAGLPLPGHTVRLLKSRSFLKLSGLSRSDQNVEEMRATTDAHGFFELSFPVDSQFRYYYLRFYDPQSFDAVKFVLPDDLEISRQVRQGRPVQASVALKIHPDWPRVKALIDQYGAGSHCGQILRSLGLPSRRTRQGEGRELWEYDKAGTAYLVEGSKVLETRKLEPASSAASETVPDRPQPATRVEEP